MSQNSGTLKLLEIRIRRRHPKPTPAFVLDRMTSA